MRSTKAIVWGAALVLGLSGCSGSGGGDAPRTAQQQSVDIVESEPQGEYVGPLDIGGAVPYVDDDGNQAMVTVLSAEWKIGTFHSEKYNHDDTPKNGAFLVLDVDWAGAGEVSSLLMRFTPDSDGVAWSPALMIAAFQPRLSSIAAPARGYVVFDVPQGPGLLEIQPLIGPSVGGWRIP